MRTFELVASLSDIRECGPDENGEFCLTDEAMAKIAELQAVIDRVKTVCANRPKGWDPDYAILDAVEEALGKECVQR